MASVLHGLPKAYASFITVHKQMDKLKTLEEVKNHLEKHEKMLKHFNENPDVEEPGAVAGNVYCTTCNKSGHNNKACRAKGKKKEEMNGAVSMIEINDTKCCKQPMNNCKSMLDSRCSKTVINCKPLFKTFNVLNGDEYSVKVANGDILDGTIDSCGDAVLPMEDSQGIVHEVNFSNVLYSSKFPMSLISVAQTCKKMNASFHFDTSKGKSYMTLKGKIYNMTQNENLFYLEMQNGVEVNAVRTASK